MMSRVGRPQRSFISSSLIQLTKPEDLPRLTDEDIEESKRSLSPKELHQIAIREYIFRKRCEHVFVLFLIRYSTPFLQIIMESSQYYSEPS